MNVKDMKAELRKMHDDLCGVAKDHEEGLSVVEEQLCNLFIKMGWGKWEHCAVQGTSYADAKDDSQERIS